MLFTEGKLVAGSNFVLTITVLVGVWNRNLLVVARKEALTGFFITTFYKDIASEKNALRI